MTPSAIREVLQSSIDKRQWINTGCAPQRESLLLSLGPHLPEQCLLLCSCQQFPVSPLKAPANTHPFLSVHSWLLTERSQRYHKLERENREGLSAVWASGDPSNFCRVGYELLGSVPDQGNEKQWPETIEIVSEVRQQEELNS